MDMNLQGVGDVFSNINIYGGCGEGGEVVGDYQDQAAPTPTTENNYEQLNEQQANPAMVPRPVLYHNAANSRPVQGPIRVAPRVNQEYPNPGTGAWSADLFNCFDDIPFENYRCINPTGCLTLWCPCIVFGRVAEIVDKGATLFTTSATIYAAIMGSGYHFLYSCSYRNKIRLLYGIPGDDFGDYCTHLWCERCALYQEYKELSNRGYDLPLGWHINMARQKQAQGIQMPPVAPNAMMR